MLEEFSWDEGDLARVAKAIGRLIFLQLPTHCGRDFIPRSDAAIGAPLRVWASIQATARSSGSRGAAKPPHHRASGLSSHSNSLKIFHRPTIQDLTIIAPTPFTDITLAALERHPPLDRLEIRRISTHALIDFLRVRGGDLRYLRLERVRNITQPVIEAISTHAPKLESLRLGNCPQIRDISHDSGFHAALVDADNLQFFVALARGCPLLKKVCVGLFYESLPWSVVAFLGSLDGLELRNAGTGGGQRATSDGRRKSRRGFEKMRTCKFGGASAVKRGRAVAKVSQSTVSTPNWRSASPMDRIRPAGRTHDVQGLESPYVARHGGVVEAMPGSDDCVGALTPFRVPIAYPLDPRSGRGGSELHQMRARGKQRGDAGDRRPGLDRIPHHDERSQAPQLRSCADEVDPEEAHDRGPFCAAHAGIAAAHEILQRARGADHDVGPDALGGQGLPSAADERGREKELGDAREPRSGIQWGGWQDAVGSSEELVGTC
ncbi:hypothetical protein BDK51DRAFT_52602 [Blyttiomyces helicus]|uniref:F-box domain-containing protein n=1 Tax=Blyttiomyces helicus TaxID=388810 RepID=A0A4P9W247_9FUNG|nr:hypothetical protein BDK51DRAFT_52602 [Blyttiomyces helicus]|eukprot:RKO86281.1 hypothetical protein BDK51DRAFT_52602 [Blyttiomyces helicus]